MQNTKQIKPCTLIVYHVKYTSLALNVLLDLLIREVFIKCTFAYMIIIHNYIFFYKTKVQVLHKNVTGDKTKIMRFLTQWFLADERESTGLIPYKDCKEQTPIFSREK